MLIGQTVRAPGGGAATYFSPWFPRQGTKGVFACNLFAFAGLSSLQVFVQTKKPENDNTVVNIKDVGVAHSVTLTADSVSSFERGTKIDGSETVQGLFEMVRYKYVVTASASPKCYVHFRMLDPTWENE